MNRKIELLSPGGDIDSIKAAISAGADAIYCGLDKFNARAKATNISFDDLQGILNIAHKNSCEVFLTLNIVVVESELPALFKLLNKLVNTSIDGVIVQDLGMFYILNKYFRSLKVHASTQATTHNQGQVLFLNKLNATRVNLSRELNIDEIKHLTDISHKNNMLTEVFVHGSYCISFSGACYMSSVHGGNSGNRGRCSQPCRDKYETTSVGKDYPLNMKDNSAFFNLKELADAGVDSLKIEGRIKKFDYVYTVVNSWRKQLQNYYSNNPLNTDNSILHKVFNRDFTNSFLQGRISKDMFIDNPRDNSVKHLSEVNNYSTNDTLDQDQAKLFDEKRAILATTKAKIKDISIAKAPLEIIVSGKINFPLKIDVITPDNTFTFETNSNLSSTDKRALNSNTLLTKFKAFNDTEYYIESINTDNLADNTIIPFKELTLIKKQILFELNNSREFIEPIEIPIIEKCILKEDKPKLSVLISSINDVHLCKNTSADIYFHIPSSINKNLNIFIELFTTNKNLIPWFTSILIGKDFDIAIELIDLVKPKLIVTNNTGIAHYAYQNNIAWIAGPYINTTNSYSLLSLKENFNCSGAFISNELNKNQIRGIKKPDDFNLHYSIYHPIILMTSRVCLFHQVSGCEKHLIDNSCIDKCEKLSTITNMKSNTFYIEKEKGNYHNVYNDDNYLNTDIINDFSDKFSNFFIDLRDIKTKTRIDTSKLELINIFEDLINNNTVNSNKIKQVITSTINSQYKKGI